MRQVPIKTKVIWMWLALILLVMLLIAGSFFSYKKITTLTEEARRNTTALQEKIDNSRRYGYVAMMDIKQGDILAESMLQYSKDISSDVSQDLFVSENDIGKTVTLDIKVNQPLLTNMVTDPLPENYRERECSFIWLNSNLTDNDFVDVRILFQNGEDYIVASKKPLKNISIAANNCFLWLTEEEILSLDSAIVDANLRHAKIYVTKYLKPAIQEPSVVNYEPNADVIALMAADPNIVTASARVLSAEARNAMESRLQLFDKAYPDFQFDDTLVDGADKTSDASAAANKEPEITEGLPQASQSEVQDAANAQTQEEIDDTNTKESEIKYVE